MTHQFKIEGSFKPAGSQPEAIKQLTEGIQNGVKAQTLLGVTGSGKTFTIANVIAAVQKPTLVIAHNKTLAAQLYREFKEFFPIIASSISSRFMTTIVQNRISLKKISM